MSAKKLNAVLAGCGGISGNWLNAVQNFKDVKIIGLVDLNLSAAEARNKEYNTGADTGTSLKEMLEKHPEADIVFDCTIPEAHFDTAMTAFEYNCHLLGEKPMTDTMEKATAMVKTANSKKLVYAVIQNRRYQPEIVAFTKFLNSGKLGKLTTLNADFYLGAHFGGFREQMDHVLLLDMAIHSFDQARMISGADPVRVFCHEFNPSGSWYKHGASAMATFEMSNGIIFNYRGSWCAEGLNTSWECDWRACCETGSATWDGAGHFQAEKVSGNKGFIMSHRKLKVPQSKLRHHGHAGVIRDFLSAIKNNTTPQTICTDNIKSLAMVHAAIESSKTGKPVQINI